MNAGYQTVNDSSTAPLLHAQLMTFWSDGYVHNRIALKMPIDLRKTESTTSDWMYDLDVNVGFTPMGAGFSQFNSGYDNMLEEAKNKLVEQFNSSEFENHYNKIK